MLQVIHYRPYWWRCNGPCVKLPPYFGIVRCAIDRDPSSTDKWWSIHQRQCNGQFTKIIGPGCSRETINKCENIHRGEKDVKKIDIDTNNDTNVVKDTKPDTKWFSKAEKKFIKSSQIDNNEQLETDKFSNAKNGKPDENRSIKEISVPSSKNGFGNIHGFKTSGGKIEMTHSSVFAGSGWTMNGSKIMSQKPLRDDDINTKNSDMTKKSENFFKRFDSNFDGSTNKRIKLDLNDETKNKTIGTRAGIDLKSGSHYTVGKLRHSETNSLTNRNLVIKSSNVKSKNIGVITEESCHDDVEQVNLIDCPACPAKLPMGKLNEHLDYCLA